MNGALGVLGRRPFELLLELEALGRAACAGRERAGGEWEGMALRVDGHGLLVKACVIREVVPAPMQMTRIPGGRHGLRGIAQVHGDLLPVSDLGQLLATERYEPDAPRTDVPRPHMLVVEHDDLTAGVLVDEVLGLRRFPAADRLAAVAPFQGFAERFVLASFRRGAETWLALDLPALLGGQHDSPLARRVAE